MDQLKQILNLTRGHNRFVRDRIDLIASNSWVSQFVRLTMCSSLPNNYCIGLPGSRLYGGCAYIDMLEREVVRLAGRLFEMKHVVVQFLSGMQANIGAYNAILKPGDTVMSALPRHGGHYSHNAEGPLRFFSPRVVPVPFDESHYTVDLDGLKDAMARERPKLLVLGWSEFLFPHPLPEIRKLCDSYGVRLMYDMSHVAGLIAGRVFQPDLSKYADIVTSSTGKSLHAPDHGMVLFNDAEFRAGVLDAVMPLLTSNTHPHEMAALGVALAEAAQFGRAYAAQVVRNAKALGRALSAHGLKVLYPDLGFTESHTVLVEFAASEVAVSLLDRARILCNACALPWDAPGVSTGLRFGTQVVTRRGMTEADMAEIGAAIGRVLVDAEDPDAVGYAVVRPLAERHDRAAFSFDFHFPLGHEWYHAPYQHFRVDDALGILHGLVPFANCTPSELEGLVDRMDLVAVERERVLFERGDLSDSVYFVSRGTVDVIRRSGDEVEVVTLLREGSHFGELGVMSGAPRLLTVRARAGSRLLRMKADDFREMLARLPAVRQYFQRYVASLKRPDHAPERRDAAAGAR